MMEQVMHHMGGVAAFGVISLCIFCVVFTIAFFWAMRLKKPYLEAMRQLPLEGDAAPQPHNDSNPEDRL